MYVYVYSKVENVFNLTEWLTSLRMLQPPQWVWRDRTLCLSYITYASCKLHVNDAKMTMQQAREKEDLIQLKTHVSIFFLDPFKCNTLGL